MKVLSSVKNELDTQIRVIKALLIRETVVRYGRKNLGFLWILVEPMLFTIGIIVLWSVLNVSHNSAISICAFALTGYSSILIWRNAVGRCLNAVATNKSLLHHHQIKILHVFLCRILLELSGTTLSFILLSLIFINFRLMSWPDNFLLVVWGWFLLCWFAFGLALVIGVLSELYKVTYYLWTCISYLLYPLSGAAYMVDWLPDVAQKCLLLLPMVNGIEVLREGYFGVEVSAHYSIVYMIYFCSSLSLIGLLLVKRLDNQ